MKNLVILDFTTQEIHFYSLPLIVENAEDFIAEETRHSLSNIAWMVSDKEIAIIKHSSLKQTLTEIYDSNQQGLEESDRTIQLLIDANPGKEEVITRFFELMADLEEANDELQNSGGRDDDDESERLQETEDEVRSEITQLINTL